MESRITKGPGLPGSPNSTAILTPAGRNGGPGPQATSLGVKIPGCSVVAMSAAGASPAKARTARTSRLFFNIRCLLLATAGWTTVWAPETPRGPSFLHPRLAKIPVGDHLMRGGAGSGGAAGALADPPRLVQPGEEVVDHPLVLRAAGADHAVDVHVDEARGQLFHGAGEPPLALQRAQLGDQGRQGLRPAPQQGEPGGEVPLVVAGGIEERRETWALAAEALAERVGIAGVIAEALPDRSLGREVEAEVREQAVDSGQGEAPADVRRFVAVDRFDDLQHGFAVRLEKPL